MQHYNTYMSFKNFNHTFVLIAMLKCQNMYHDLLHQVLLITKDLSLSNC